MSTFKRYQSKVFYSQMEAQDRATLLPATPSPQHRRRPLPFPASREHEEAFSLSAEEEDDEENNLDVTTDPENVTVIHISMCAESPAARSINNEAQRVADLPIPTEQQQQQQQHPENNLPAEERSFSPASRGQRSQDSGFSDSERSDSSELSPESPRRSRRRRSRRRHRLSGRAHHHREPLVDAPPHTSTPKREHRQIDRPPICEPPRQLDFDIHDISTPESVETLGDFLYTSDPPLDEESAPPEAEAAAAAAAAVDWTIETRRLERETTLNVALDVQAPVKAWLDELRTDVEEECMATLQSKSLPRRRRPDDEPESRDLRLLTASATTAAKKVIDMAERFDKRYQRAIDSINSSQNGKVDEDLLASIEAEASEILIKLGSTMPRRINKQDNLRNIMVQLTRLKSSVDRALDTRLDFYIEKVVRGLEDAPREGGSTARGALAALTALGLAGPRAGASIARSSGIRALLTSLVSSGRLSSELRSASLRALASVCCCLEAIDQFVAEGGPEILADVLAAETTPHTEKSEAAALLVQVTAPWMQRVGLPYVEPHGREFVRALTGLAETTTCKQTLLLAAAGINHLAYSKKCVAAIVECDSVKKLLRCVKKSKDGNVWLMEQVASLVSQVARVPQARGYLAESRASVALVCFLRMQPPGLGDEHRRLVATAREALTRLCVDPEVAKQVVAVGGSDCLPVSECNGPDCLRPPATEQPFRSTKSLRVARKIAAEQIDIARIRDCSPR